ncbi:MAG: hypothetical protein K0U47_09850 [Epsilonproteobacteria bacterium]|nr:hypothetical protein [Campylobacterota bacterium]
MKQLKIGILIDDTRLEKFKVEILHELQKSDFCAISKFIMCDKIDEAQNHESQYFLYRLFNKVDAKLFGRGTKYLGLESIEEMVNSVDSEILEDELDVILNLTTSRTSYVSTAKYGLWEYCYKTLPEGYWEVINNDPYTEVSLQQRGYGFDKGYMLDTFRTMTERKSMVKNRDLVSWRSHMMMVRNLKKLATLGDLYFEDKKSMVAFDHTKSSERKKFFDLQFGFSDDALLTPPTNGQMLVAGCQLLKKYTQFSLRKFFPMDRWLILYSETKEGEINSNLDEYKRLYAPSENYFIADPFVVDEGEKSYLFFEELDYATAKGYLKVCEYDARSGKFKEPKMVMEQPYHLSYPNVFKHKDVYYMIPESYENGSVDLFEAVEFPTKWEKKKTLLSDVSAVDATLYFYEGKWWMFVAQAPKEDFSMNDELYLYYCSDFLTDDWIPHTQNPVVADALTARPAGNLIEKEGKLYRPAQDCSGIYGRKIVINEVEVLNENVYKESVKGEITAEFSKDLVAVHTLNSSDTLTVIDAIKSR